MERVFIAHIETATGLQDSFRVDASSYNEAHEIANEQLDDGEFVRGIVEVENA